MSAAPHAPTIPSPARLALRPDFVQREANLTHDALRDEGTYWDERRVRACVRYQHHVYRWAARLARHRRVRRVLDIGCGPAQKLSGMLAPLCEEAVGIDQVTAIEAGRREGARVRFVEMDLEAPDPSFSDTFDLIICADVVEHLLDPRPVMALIRRCCHRRTLCVLSTPERARRFGRRCATSPKPEHIREWDRREFVRFVRASGMTVRASRLLPVDDSPVLPALWRDALYRSRLRRRSALSCHAVLCGAGAA